MHEHIAPVVDSALEGRDASAKNVEEAVAAIMDGEADPLDIAAMLTALAAKGEAATEITGAARAMISRATRITSRRERLLDTCGTGGDGLHTFNISTATALVTAACEVPVAKHGNRSVSSSSGSSDVLAALGVEIALPPAAVSECLDELGIGFCFAPLFHGAMKHAAPVRGQLGFRTLFNLVGPLTNPAAAHCQLLGANCERTAGLLAEALRQLGRPRGLVVCGNDELDEVSLWGGTLALEVNGSDNPIQEHRWQASDFGLETCDVESLRVSSPSESASVIRDLLAGQPGPARNIVLANTSAALLVADRVDDLAEGVSLAAGSLDDGSAASLLDDLVACTNRLAGS